MEYGTFRLLEAVAHLWGYQDAELHIDERFLSWCGEHAITRGWCYL